MAFIIECMETANAYWGELLGLMVIHMLCLAVQQMSPHLQGVVMIYLVCLGTLGWVRDLQPYKIRSKYWHLDF